MMFVTHREMKSTVVMFIMVFGFSTLFILYNYLDDIGELHRRYSIRKPLWRLESSLFDHVETRPYSDFSFNVNLSHTIPIDRDVPLDRSPDCDVITFPEYIVEKVSIVIPVHNEAWSVLLRAINSVVLRTPDNVLGELILVDDCSEFNYTKEDLETYVKYLPNTSILRNTKREGLMRSRMKGARVARYPVLIFLDAHVEVNEKWIEPLLYELSRNNRSLLTPYIDNIDPQTLEYSPWSTELMGTFEWNLRFAWGFVSEHSQRERSTKKDPILTHTLIGCVMVTMRDVFFELGGFDEGMDIWGAENIEISFRYWMCGGGVKIVPCSRVGHMFRRILPYKFPNGTNTVQKNRQRVAEVWLGDYKKFFYGASQKLNLTEAEEKSLSERKAQIDKLQCKNFDWFLKEVAPGIVIPKSDDVVFGTLKNFGGSMCMVAGSQGQLVNMTSCQFLSQNTTFSVDNLGRLKYRKYCVAMSSRQLVIPANCTSELQPYVFRASKTNALPKRLVAKIKNVDVFDLHKPVARFVVKAGEKFYCLTHVTDVSTNIQSVAGVICNEEQLFQIWVMSHKMNI